MSASQDYWLNINNQAIVRFSEPLNPGFVFWLRRRFRARVVSDGGERVRMTRQRPFTEAELEEIYCETEYRQQMVSNRRLPVPESVLEGRSTLVD